MGIKLIALDLDGTTLDSNICLANETKKAIEMALDAGVQVVPCTGRVFTQLPKALKDIQNLRYAITANGARVTDMGRDNRSIYNNIITRDTVMHLLDIFEAHDILLESYLDGQTYITRQNIERLEALGVPETYFDFFIETCHIVETQEEYFRMIQEDKVEKFNIFCKDLDEREVIKQQLATTSDVMVTSSMPENIEINNATANKGNGLKRLCHSLGIHSKEVMAIGDSNNDMEMLKFAGLSVAMGNAAESVKAMSDYITKSNDAHGVAYALDKFILKQMAS